MNVYLASFLGFAVVVALMVIAVEVAEKYKKEIPNKEKKDNRRKRRHSR